MRREHALIVDLEETVLEPGLEVVTQLWLGQRPQKLGSVHQHVPVPHALGTMLQVLSDRGPLGRRRHAVQVVRKTCYDVGTLHSYRLADPGPDTIGPRTTCR